MEVLSQLHTSFKNVPVLVMKLAYCQVLVHGLYKVTHIFKVSFEKTITTLGEFFGGHKPVKTSS